MQLTNAQQRAIREISHHLQVIACAGSGKTEVITRRIAYILRHDLQCRPENIVAFTFTNKAAASMKTRIFKNLAEINQYIPQEYENMAISTIHSFLFSSSAKILPRIQKYAVA